mmetsp:Transcript_21144/g.36294  ORF Transcript_21144/g.36294 Transcript_21144/m.36294 type:complete len:127 (-) Transcript_21144:1556-1936(-)
MRSVWLPRSAMRPLSSTMISSACTTVERRWAMKMAERLDAMVSRAGRISFSVFESIELVASSQMSRLASLRRARAMATRCFSPPESLRPRSPTWVSYCFGNDRICSWMCASFAASITSSCDAPRRP